MFIPLAMIIMIVGMTSVIDYAQEAPVKTMSEEEIMQSKEYQDFMAAQTAFSEFTGESSSPEYKKLEENVSKAQEAFLNIMPQDKPAQESSEPKPSPETSDEVQKESLPTNEDSSPEKDAPAAEVNTEKTPAETSTPEPEVDNSTEYTTEEKSSDLEEAPAAPVIPSIEEQEALIPEETVTEEPAGIDTMSLENPQGNWLFKRIWWERAQERYERIRILVDAIWEQRNTFFKERNQLDRNILEPFYMGVGIDRGELQIILSEITDFLEQQRDQQDKLSDQERVLYETYITEEETLKQLKLDVDMITNLDNAIDEALGTFMNQINRVKSYESEAWKNFKEIAHILNDARARELYYMVEGAARNIKTISIYLEQEFFTHFHKLIEEAKTRVARVQSQMDGLKEKGVSFQRQAEQLEQQQTASQDQEDEDDEEQVKPKPKLGWIDWMIEGTSDVFSYIWSIIRMPYDMIFGN